MRKLVVGILVCSVGLNLYLLWSMPRSQVRGDTEEYSDTSRGTAVGSERDGRLPVDRAQFVSAPVLGKECESRFLDCQAALSKTRERLERHLPLDERFQQGEQNPEATARISQFVAGAFGDHPPDYSFECRQTACRLQILWPKDEPNDDVMQYFQGEKSHDVFDGAMFSSTKPGSDPLSKKTYHRQEMFFGLPADDNPSGMILLEKIVAEFRASSASKDCFDRLAIRGDLSVALEIGEKTGNRVAFEHGGSLVGTASEACLLGGLQSVIARTVIPEHVRDALLYVSILQPPSAPQ
jgi:hypothetical protein